MLRSEFAKLAMPEKLLDVYRKPPQNPAQCTFARTTLSITADLKRRIMPCQFGGDPDCSQCGCLASAGLDAITRHRMLLGLRVGSVYELSAGIGRFAAAVRQRGRSSRRDPVPLGYAPK